MPLPLASRPGPKLERLLRLRALPSLRDLVPPVHPVDALAPDVVDLDGAPDAAVAAYAAALRAAQPDLAQAVHATCGPAPWIVRSAGIEDLAELLNAGGYDSLICLTPADLHARVAEVALSGLGERSTRQRALAGDAAAAQAIACFVQPLLPISVAERVHRHHVPLIDTAVLERMESICTEVMVLFGFAAVDCEWGLETDRGFVSVTTLMPRDVTSAHVSHTLGFGFASAQTSGSRPTALALRPAGTPLRLWRGERLLATDVRRLHLLQARPTRLDPALRTREAITAASRALLTRQYETVPGRLLTLGARIHGRALIAPDLATAWRHFLGLSADARVAVALVLVDEGNAEEHAGLMFRQERVTCVRTATARIPAGTEVVAFDGGVCFLGDASMARAVATEARRELVLPDDCALLFPPAALSPDGALTPTGAETLRRLQALPIAADIGARLLARSTQPARDLWLEDADGAVESPSLLARRLRLRRSGAGGAGDASGAGGAPDALTRHAASYVRAARLASGDEDIASILSTDAASDPTSIPTSGGLAAAPGGAPNTAPVASSSRASLDLSSRASDALRELARHPDLRLPLALLDWRTTAAWLPRDLAQGLLLTAAARASEGDHDTAALVLGIASLVESENRRLPMHDSEEAVELVRALAAAFDAGLTAEHFDAVRALRLPLGAVAELATSVQRHPTSLAAVSAFHDAVAEFRGVAGGGDTDALSQALASTWDELRETLDGLGLAHLVEQLRGTLIETFDASLKAILGLAIEEAAERHDDAAYRRYLAVMRHWIDFLQPTADNDRDRLVLDRFREWLAQWSAEPVPESFEIEDRNWRVEFEVIAAPQVAAEEDNDEDQDDPAEGGTAVEAAERYENPHVLHNLLHQWSLAGLRIDTDRLPRRVRALEQFCATFSSRSTKVLRFERELLEIQIPMGTHKASYVFAPRQITVEWTEPPDCPGDEIARILAYEVILTHLRDWMFPSLTIRRERVLGTWTLFIRLRADDADAQSEREAGGLADAGENGGGWRIEALHRFVAATRLLFDASYDFSYVDNDAVDGLDERLDQPGWPAIFERLVHYRAVLEDASQYVALHALPLSSTVSAIAQSGVVRGIFRRCLRDGATRGLALIDGLARSLDRLEDTERWRHRYEHLRQACLALSAMWPREGLTALATLGAPDALEASAARTARASRDAAVVDDASATAPHVGHDLLAACLFCRADLRDELRRVATARGPTLSGLPGLIVRHAPEIALAAWGPQALAEQLADTGARWRRARHFVLAHAADRLAPTLLDGLLSGLESVPLGLTPDTDAALDARLATLGPRLRFVLARGVDWTALAGAAGDRDGDGDGDHEQDEHDDADGDI